MICFKHFSSALLLFGLLPSTPLADWLVTPPNTTVQLVPFSVESKLSGQSLSNGLLSRSFITSPDFCTWSYISHLEDSGPAHLLRELSPDSFVTLDGIQYAVGGLVYKTGTSAYLNRTEVAQTAVRNESAFHYISHTIAPPTAPFKWIPGSRGSRKDQSWPPQVLLLLQCMLSSS
jgi:hypothetical protein